MFLVDGSVSHPLVLSMLCPTPHSRSHQHSYPFPSAPFSLPFTPPPPPPQPVQAERSLAKSWVLASGQICSVDLAFQVSQNTFTLLSYVHTSASRGLLTDSRLDISGYFTPEGLSDSHLPSIRHTSMTCFTEITGASMTLHT